MPKSDIAPCPKSATSGLIHRSKTFLFDYAVGLCDQLCRYSEAKLLRCLEVDDQIPMGLQIKRHLCWIATIEDFNGLRSEAPSLPLKVESVPTSAYQPMK